MATWYSERGGGVGASKRRKSLRGRGMFGPPLSTGGTLDVCGKSPRRVGDRKYVAELEIRSRNGNGARARGGTRDGL